MNTTDRTIRHPRPPARGARVAIVPAGSPRPGMGRLMLSLAALGLIFVAGRAQAEEDQGPVFGVQKKRPWITFDTWDGRLDLTAQRTQNKITNVSTEKDSENLFTELLTLHTHGAILHPNVVELDMSGSFGLQQRSFESHNSEIGATNSNDNTLLYAYTLSASILRQQTVSYTVYAQRNEDTVSRDFGPSLTATNTLVGATANITSSMFPTRIRVEHNTDEEKDPSSVQGYSQTQDLIQAHTEWVAGNSSQLVLDYNYTNLTQKAELGNAQQSQINEVTLSHYYRFGEDGKNNLTSSLDFFDTTGDFVQQRFRGSEQLTLQHTPSLQSYYRYNFTHESRDTFDQTMHQGEIGFDHKLYKSLVTHGAIGMQLIDQTEGQTSDEFYARLNFDYTKKIPFGVLGLNLGLSYDWRNNQAQTGSVEIIDQPGTFTPPLGVVLNQQHVNPRSIVVTDSNGLRVYVPGIDYNIISFPNRVEIRRVLTGAIVDNQSVLVDYGIDPQAANTLQTSTFNIGGHYDLEQGPLKGLTLYAHYIYQDQTVNTDSIETIIPDNIRELLIGSQYRIEPFTFTAEETWHDSSMSPYNSLRLNASFYQTIFTNCTTSLNAGYNVINYTDVGENVKYLDFNGAVTYQPSREWQFIASAGYRNQKDTIVGDTTGLEEQLRINWRHRQTYIYMLLRNVNLDNAGNESSFQLFQIGIQRSF